MPFTPIPNPCQRFTQPLVLPAADHGSACIPRIHCRCVQFLFGEKLEEDAHSTRTRRRESFHQDVGVAVDSDSIEFLIEVRLFQKIQKIQKKNQKNSKKISKKKKNKNSKKFWEMDCSW